MLVPDGMLLVDPFQAGILIGVAMHRVRRECRPAHGDIFRAIRTRRAVTHPFATMHDDRLTGGYFLNGMARFDLHLAPQHNRVLLELRRLSRLSPADGLVILAILSAAVWEFTWPVN